MKMSDVEIIGFMLIAFGIMGQFLETWYFGWNTKPCNQYELIADQVTQTTWVIGLAMLVWGGSCR